MQISLGRLLGNKSFCFVGIPQKCKELASYGSGNELIHNYWAQNRVFVMLVNSFCKYVYEVVCKGD